MSSLFRRPVTRWAAPVVAAVFFIGGGSVLSALTNAAQADLAPRSAAQLLVDIQHAKLAGLSGTIVQSADLGLPALPAGAASGLTGGDSSMTSLVSGSHTLRAWYAGPQHIRISLMGQLGESDLIRNGTDVWNWSSSSTTRGTADHWVLPTESAPAPAQTQPELAMTPQQAADKALAAISPTTSVTTNGTAVVAGRSAYLLTLAPKTADTLVSSVQIAIDGATHVPTRVQVFAKGMSTPALSVGFTSFDPHTPTMSVFGFNPPPGTKVTQGSLSDLGSKAPHTSTGTDLKPTVVGSGWSSVLVTTVPAELSTTGPSTSGGTSGASGNSLTAILDKLPTVHGTWGSGHLLAGTVFSALLTDDGRLVIGAVPPAALYSALGSASSGAAQ